MQSEQQQRIMGYFIEEAKDHLNTIEQGLLNLQNTIEDPEMVSEVFRAAHSVKGGAAMLGLGSIQQTAHRLEDYFKVLKECPIRVDQKLESLFLRVFDTLQELLEQLQGPFGLTDDKANEVMAEVEPVFGSLNEHLTQLVSQSGGTPPEDVELIPISGFPTTSPPIPVAAGNSGRQAAQEESALQLIFKSDVPARLREMLQLFKQADDVNGRQQLQTICQSLMRAGEQFDLPSWCELLDVARRAVSNTDNTYRTLAPILIRDIKQAQEFVLAGNAVEIQASESLRSLLPPELEEMAMDDDFANLLAEIDFEEDSSIPEFIEFELEPEEQPLTAASASTDESDDGEDWFNITTAIQMDDDDSSDLGLGLDGIDLDAGQPSDLNLDLGQAFSSVDAGPVIDQNGPEVGIAELNSLADLFEGEVPDLGMTWQEEEIISDSSADFANVAELNSSSDFSDSDFSDLLFDEEGLEELDLEEHYQDEDLSDLLNVSEISYTNSSASLESETETTDSSDLLSGLTDADWNFDTSDNLASSVESFNPSDDLASGFEGFNPSNDLTSDFESFSSSNDLASDFELALGTDAVPTDADANRGLDNLSELFAGLDDSALEGNLDADELILTEPSDEPVSEPSNISDTNPEPDITSTGLGDSLDFLGSEEVESLSDNPFEIEDFFGNDTADLAVDFQSDLDNPFTLSESEQDDLDSTGLEVLQDFSDDDALISSFIQDAESDNLTELGEEASSESASVADPWAALDAEDDIFLASSTPSGQPPASDDDLTTDLWADSSEGFVAAPPVTGSQSEAIAPVEEDFFDQLPDPFAEEEPLSQANDFQFIDFDGGTDSSGLAVETADAELSDADFGDLPLDNADSGFGDIVLEESAGEDFSLGDEDDTDALLDDNGLDSELDQAFEADFPQDMSLFEAESFDEASPDFLSFSDSLSFESELPNVTDTAEAPIEAIEMDLAALLDEVEVTEEDVPEAIAPDVSVNAGVAVEDETFLSNLFDDGDSADVMGLGEVEEGIDALAIDSVSPEIAYAPETSQDSSEALDLSNLDDDLFGANEFGLTLDDDSSMLIDASIPDTELGLGSADTAESLVDLDFGWDQPDEAIAPSDETPFEGFDSQASDGVSDTGLDISTDLDAEPSDLGDMLLDFGSEDLAAEDFETENFDAEDFGSEDFNLEDFGTEDITDTTSDFDNSLDSIDFGNLSLDMDDAFATSEEDESTDGLNLSLDIPESEITGTDDSADFDRLDALLIEEPEPLQSDLASLESSSADDSADDDIDGFSDLDALLSGVADDPPSLIDHQPVSSDDGFADLDALLAEDVATSTPRSDGLDDFEDLEALLGDQPEPRAVTPTPPPPPPRSTGSDFDDLEKLLEDADQTLGGPPTARGARGPSLAANRNKNRPTRGVLSDQTMRVSVKNLDNLNNLVGELVVNRNSLEQAEERLRQFLDNLLYQVQQLSDVGQRMRDLYERSLLESSLLSSRKTYQMSSQNTPTPVNHATGMSFDALEMDRFTGFHTLSQEMIELIVRVRESASDIDFVVDETDQVTRNFRQITTQLQEGLTRSRMVPFAQTADRLPRAVRDISLKCGKQAELTIEGRETLIDKMILEQLYDPMTHLVNNAITHGIETPDERLSRGKGPTGRITVRTFHQGNQTVISVTDDGAGIDPEIVKRKAIEKGLITPSEAETMSRLDVYDLLFHHGFSTKDKADDFAGRGVGMDVVRTSLNEIRGVVNIDSTINKGTTFTIRLPLTLSISKALCCISNRARIAFPMDGVEDMLDVPKERILRDDQDRPCIQWRDQLLPFQPLSELLKYNRSLGRGSVYGGNQEDDIVSVVVLRSNAGNFLALQVDQVLGEQEIVIKQLEGPVPKPIGVAGATVLGDGRIMPIADVLELIDLSMGRIRREAGSSLWEKDEDELPPEVPESKTEPTVLIVDDSITVRELLSMTFNKVGYRVEQARDGQEAWEKLRSGLPCDLVFCDIEMPRMDGLELLSRIQKDPSLGHLPIAMLTSRGADRHRQMAIQLGAKGYFTKPYLEEALLDAAQRMLKGEVLVNSGS